MNTIKNLELEKFVFNKHNFLYKDEGKLKDFLSRVQKVKSESDAIDFFKHTTSKKNFHHQNQRPIDKIEFIAMFELYDKLIKSLVSQLESQYEQGNDVEKCKEIESKIAEIIKHYTWLLLTGKNRWSEEKLKDFIDIQCSYLVDLFALSSDPAVYFQIYKAIPINDYELEDRNQIIAFLSHFDKNIDTMKQNLHDYFINCLNLAFPVHDNQKIYDEKVEQFLQLTDFEYIKQHSSYSIIRKITQEILKVSKSESGSQKIQINLICSLVHYIKLSLSSEFINSPYHSMMQCLSLLTQIYYDDKKKHKHHYKSLEFLKTKGEGPKELFEEISQYIEKYKDTADIQMMLDFLANLEYPKLFCSDLLAPVYEKSSLFYKYELFFCKVLEDIYDHCTSDSPLKNPISKVVLENPMNLKDFLEISLQTIESLRYLMKTFQSITQIQSQNTSVQRQNLIDLHQKLLNIHKNIFMSFARSEWVFDTPILEIYLAFSTQIFPEFYRSDMQSELQVKMVELIVKYVRKDTKLHCKYKDDRREVSLDEFYFVIKVYLKIIEENISGEHYEEYLNNLFFNIEELVSYCAEKRNQEGEHTISCLLMNMCFQSSNVEQMENYFSWKNESKLILYEHCIDLFLKENMQINTYFDNFITCCPEKQLNSSDSLRGIYTRMCVKYNFTRIFDNSNSQVQLNLKKEGYNISVNEINKQMAIQIENAGKEKNMLKKYFRELNLKENVTEEFSFLYKRVIFWNNLKLEKMMQNMKGLLTMICGYVVDEENSDHHFFKIYYNYSLQFVKFLTCFTKKNIIGNNFLGVSSQQKHIIETFKIQENMIALFEGGKKEIIQKVGRYILRLNSKDKFIDVLCSDEEEKMHIISQQLIIYLNYFVHSAHHIESDSKVFTLLVDILISIFTEFLNSKFSNSKQTSSENASYLLGKIESIYIKNQNILNKFGQSLNIIQKLLNEDFNLKLKEKKVEDHESSLNKLECPLVREKFFDIIQFALGICNTVVEQPQNIIKFPALLDKLLQVTSLVYKKTNKIGSNFNERYILMCQCFSKKQNDQIISTYFDQIIPKWKQIVEKITGGEEEEKKEEKSKYIGYLAQNYETSNSIFPYQIIMNELMQPNESQQNIVNILHQLSDISKLDNQIVKAICKSSENSNIFSKFLCSFSKFEYMETILKLDVIEKDQYALKIQEALIEQLEDLIQENKSEINSLATLLKMISQTAHQNKNEDRLQNKELILTIVQSLQYIVEEDEEEDNTKNIDEAELKIKNDQFQHHLLLLYFIHQVLYNFNEKIDDGIIEKIFKKLINSVNKNIPLSVYNLIFTSASLMRNLKQFCSKKTQFSSKGISLYKHLSDLISSDIPSSSSSSLDKSNKRKTSTNSLPSFLQLLSQFIDLDNEEEVLYLISQLLSQCQTNSDLFDSIFQIICNILMKNNEFYSDSISCKIAIINKVVHIQKIQHSQNDDFVLELNHQKYEQNPDEDTISYKTFLEKYSTYFFAPSYYQLGVNNETVREIIQKTLKNNELKEVIELIKKKQYFQQNDLSIKIMKIIIDNEKTNIKLLHVLINLFPQVIFIFKEQLADIINGALNVEYNINGASNFIQNVFEIVSIDQEFLDIYKQCLTQKLKDMINQDTPQVKLIEVVQLIFPMEKKYQRLIMNYLAQQVRFGSDQSKNFSQTNSQRWNLDYFNNVIHYKEIKKESNNILEEPNKFIYESLSKHLGELLQNESAYSEFQKEYLAQLQSLNTDTQNIFGYKEIAIQREFSQLENLIESNTLTFTQYHNSQSSNVQNTLSQTFNQQNLEILHKASTEKLQKSPKIVEKQEKSSERKIASPKIEEKKQPSEEDEWESDENDDEDDGDNNDLGENKAEDKTKEEKKEDNTKQPQNDEEEWEDEDYEGSGDDDEEEENGSKQLTPKGKFEDDEDSSDYDHEGEKKQSGKKQINSPSKSQKSVEQNDKQETSSNISNPNPLKFNSSQTEQDQISKIVDILDQSVKKIDDLSQLISQNLSQITDVKQNLIQDAAKEEIQKDDNEYEDEESESDAGGQVNQRRRFDDLENEEDEDDEEEDEEEDEEKIKKENEIWNKYLVLKERWSAAKYINKEKREQEIIKQQIFEYLRDLRRHKENIAIFVDIVKQLDEDDLKRYLHTRFPKYISLKNSKPKPNKKKNEEEEKKKTKVANKGDDDDDFEDDSSEEEAKNSKESHKKNDNEEDDDDEFEEVDDENNEEEKEDEDEGNLLHISSSEEELSESGDEMEFDEDNENEYESSLFDYEHGDGGDDSRSHSKSSSSSHSEDEEDNSHHDDNHNKSLNDRQWSPVAQTLPQEKLIKLYIDSLVYYDEKSIENIVKSFYFSSLSQIINNELLNPVHGPQLMDALFFLLVNPQLDKYPEIKEDKELEFFVSLGEKQLFLKNYLVLYDNAMSFFRNSLCTNISKQLLAYFTLDETHWSYLPQLSIIKKLKKITNHKQMSGLQTLIMLFGDKFKYVDIYENRKQIQVLNQISSYIKSTHIVLDHGHQEGHPKSHVTIHNPVLRQIDIDNIMHYYYFENQHFSHKGFLFSFLKKGLTNEPKYILVILGQFLENQSKFLIQDVIELINKGISDVKRILESPDVNAKKFAMSHLYEIFSDTEFNPIYESFKSFAANLRTLMRIYFKKVKKSPKSEQKAEIVKLQEILCNQSLMKLFTQILKQLHYLHANIITSFKAGTTSVIDNDENGELQAIFQSFIPLVKLMYMLHPYYDIDSLTSLLQPELDNPDSLPELAKLSSKSQSSKFESIHSNKLIDIVNEEEDKILKVEEFKKILEQGFCSIIKLFVGMDDQLFQKYISVVSKDPQNLRSLDLDTRVFAIQAKAVKRAQKEQDCNMDIITLKIDRKCVFEDTFRTIMRQKPHQLVQKQFEVRFRKEEGIDQSGLTREWYSCISKELFDPRKGLFRVATNKFIVYPSTTSYLVPDHITIFRFSGQIIAKSVLEGYLIGVDFPKFFLKHITGSSLKISDLDDIEPELVKNLLWILENPVEDLCLTFIYEYEEMEGKKTIELVPNGKNVDVTDANKKEYVDKLIDYVMIQQIQVQTKSFLEGFFSIFPKSELFLVDWMELGLKIAGTQEIDFKELRTNTTYQGGYSEISPLVQWFWEILMTFDDKMKRKFLFFLSGSYKIPIGGYKDMGFTISKVFDTQNLPVAHTCFNQLDLPQYEDKDTLQKKLFQAILEGNESFGIA